MPLPLSIGEKERESYEAFKKAGADRYLLRHETANEEHYRKLHPKELSLSHRIRCLETLKSLGYQTGAGFMTGSPGQTMETLIDDLEFLERLQPEMVGIGPFIPHHDTPFNEAPPGRSGTDSLPAESDPPPSAKSPPSRHHSSGDH